MLFSPVLTLLLGIFTLVATADLQQALPAVVFLSVGGIPVLVYFIYTYFRERDQEIDPGREARQSIYLLAVFSFTLTTVIFGTELLTNDFWFNMGMLMAIFFALGFLIDKYFDKYSMHMATFAFMVMLLIDNANPGFALLFMLTPVIIWSRLELHRHTWLQIMWGWALGLAVGLLAWTL